MKIKQEHLETLKKEIDYVFEKYGKKELVEIYETGKFSRSDKVKDLQRRFCFDMLFGAGVEKFVCDVLYKYMNDEHLYTALKSICPKIEKKY